MDGRVSALPTEQTPSPDWSTVDHDVLCPLCEYNLRGLTEPRCPECGYAFAWPEVLDPQRRPHPFLYEHHPERPLWAFARTLLSTCRPTRFWQALHPTQPTSRRRLLTYWGLVFAVYVMLLLAQVAIFLHGRGGMLIRMYTPLHARAAGQLSAQNYATGHRNWVIREYGSVEAYLDYHYPTRLGRGLALQLLRDLRRTWVTWVTFLWPLVWPWIVFGVLVSLRLSMRRARVSAFHVLRCVIYGMDLVVWLGLVLLMLMLLMRHLAGEPPMASLAVLGNLTLLLYPAGIIVSTHRLAKAYRYYLRFQHPALTVILCQLLALLAVLTGVALSTLWYWSFYL